MCPIDGRVSEVIGPRPKIVPKVSLLKFLGHTNQLFTRTDLRGIIVGDDPTNAPKVIQYRLAKGLEPLKR